ncbi:hypothetical protein GTQ43_11595 [Nostoc sp. KVJ3]|uniref:hypothetical protein n=1 Tax=Nostoc sp. KVJ3 TaxID=457945 RepID=UPI002238E3DF|nr:hypothetical protein [Nostoc sp. KVJ3]MCW5314427.1 hypothetical protein [Nostoc sp. KVJ3]
MVKDIADIPKRKLQFYRNVKNQMCKDGWEMRLNDLLPLSLDTWQSTLQDQLHSYLENLEQQWFNALMLLLFLYVKKHNKFVTNKQYFFSHTLIIFAYENDKFY